MEFEIIPKTESNESYDSSAIAVKSIAYDLSLTEYEEGEITNSVISDVLEDIRKGSDIFFYLDPNGETDFLNVLSGHGWISLFAQLFDEQTDEDISYICYNPEFEHTKEMPETDTSFSDMLYTPLDLGGQSPVPKMQALTDIEAGIKAAEYFIRTGKLSTDINWLRAE